MKIGDREIGGDNPCYIVAEAGINHNGSVKDAMRLMFMAKEAGADAVKFQKRAPRFCVPRDQWDAEKDTPWGRMPYIEYKEKTELGVGDYRLIDAQARSLGIDWFVSVWDIQSVQFMEEFFEPIAYKVPSALLTDDELLRAIRDTGRPIILSSGMSTKEQVYGAVAQIMSSPTALPVYEITVCQCTSSYPLKPSEVNLNAMQRLNNLYGTVPGYSGHEMGINISMAAVALGAKYLERHITLDKTMWGTDQPLSLEPDEFKQLVDGVREVEAALGDGVKRVYDSELPFKAKLRPERVHV